MLRPVPLRRYLAVMQTRGFDAAQVLDGSGIQPALLDEPNCLIDVAAYRHVIENVVRLTGDQGIGFDMGLARELGDFGILGYASLACRTVRHSIEAFWGRYGDALGMMARITIPSGNAKTLAVEIVAARLSEPAYRFFVEEALFLLLKVGAQVSGTAARFERLEFSYPEPAYGKRYRELFDCSIRFGCDRTRAYLNRAWLEQPLLTTDAELCGLYEKHLAQLKRQIESSSTASTKLRAIFLKLNGRIPPLDNAAATLGLSPRTLRRQLQQEGSSYRQLVEAFRIEMTLDFLKSAPVTTKQLCERVGFDDVNAFRRAFRKWTGLTVSGYRGGLAKPEVCKPISLDLDF